MDLLASAYTLSKSYKVHRNGGPAQLLFLPMVLPYPQIGPTENWAVEVLINH